MVLNYSKWDNLELSDDSDIEVHPNVDKRSFIRAKQSQIHLEREQRKQQIATLKYERIINDGLLDRIDRLLASLTAHQENAEDPDDVVFEALTESMGDVANDEPPVRPSGVYTSVKEQPRYSKMMAALVDQVKKEVDSSKPDEKFEAYVQEVGKHRSRVQGLQNELLKKLAELETEESRKITSESIHTGFDSSHISKTKPQDTSKQKSATVELLNPVAEKQDPPQQVDSGCQSSGADADIEDSAKDVDDEDIQPSALGKQFAKIKFGDYRASLQFISEHPEVVSERETDGLLVEAFNSSMAGKNDYARQSVHQALLLQYCRQLGRDGVGLFFKRITTKGHQAQKVFHDDVGHTYERIRTRAKEVAEQRAKEAADDSGDVEQIQLHAVDPTTAINIVVPSASSNDPTEQQSRKIFEAFPPGLQRALESGKLDEVNRVLGKMSVEEAEEVVAQLGEGGMLSLEDKIIDATTEEGKKQVEQIERERRMPDDVEGMKIDNPAEDVAVDK